MIQRHLSFFAIISLFAIINATGPSSLDSSFNTSGPIPGILNFLPSTPVTSGELSIQSLAIQSDQKIVYAGYVTTTTGIYGILGRVNEDGTTDLTFNTTGYIIVTPNGTSLTSALFDLKLQENGAITVVGYTQQTGNNYYGLLARYTTNGTLDSSFGTGGYTYVRPTGYAAQFYALEIALNETIIIAGTALSPQTTTSQGTPTTPPTSSLPMVARFTSTGILDTTFNATGLIPGYSIVSSAVLTTINSSYIYGAYNDVTLQTNGMIVTTGYVGPTYQTPFGSYYAAPVQGNMVVARYVNGTTNSGIFDPTFNSGNILVPATSIVGTISMGFAIALQSDEQIIVAGMTNPSSTLPAYTVMRLNYIGTIDTSFNSNGQIPGTNQTIFNDTQQSSAQFIVIQPADQKILTAGMSKSLSGQFNLATIRYEQDGTIDTSFYFTTSQTIEALQFRAIALAPDKKIIAGGLDAGSSGYSFLIYRFLGGSTPELGKTSVVTMYGYNSAFLSKFLYIDFYSQVITNTAARAAALASVNAIISSYISTYTNQTGFNYISYAYLMNANLLAAKATLLDTYESDSITQAEITQFFEYIINRESQLLTDSAD